MPAPTSKNFTPVVGMDPTTGELFALATGSGGGGSSADRELVVTEYIANVAGTGYSIGDMLVRADIYDVSSTPTFVSTIWRNVTTGAALGTAPTIADLKYVGTKDAATETTLAALNAKVPAKGQATKANSTPVTLASDQDALPVTEKQSTTVTEATVAVDATIDQVVAADANRRRLIVTNNHASVKLGLSTSSSATFASCAIQLAAGESWVEALAANKAWYAIFDTGGSATVPYQTVV